MVSFCAPMGGRSEIMNVRQKPAMALVTLIDGDSINGDEQQSANCWA